MGEYCNTNKNTVREGFLSMQYFSAIIYSAE